MKLLTTILVFVLISSLTFFWYSFGTLSIHAPERIGWQKAMFLIKNCQVTQWWKTHKYGELIVLKDGSRKSITNPNIHELETLMSNYTKECKFEVSGGIE